MSIVYFSGHFEEVIDEFGVDAFDSGAGKVVGQGVFL
jgi:hypothetical protein